MPADSVHCCVTSPPYWGLRDYGTPAQVWGGIPIAGTAGTEDQSNGIRLAVDPDELVVPHSIIRRILHQRVLKQIGGLRRNPAAEQKPGFREPVEAGPFGDSMTV
jgi:DNA modification methylase